MSQAAAPSTEGDLFDEARPQPGSSGSRQPEAAGAQHEVQERLDKYFGKDDTLSEEDLFLKRFIANRVHSCFMLCSLFGLTVLLHAE